jgi:hypothetical protein
MIDEKHINWIIAVVTLVCLATVTTLLCRGLEVNDNSLIMRSYADVAGSSTSSDEAAIGDGQLRERLRNGILFRKQPNGDSEVLFDGSIAAAIRWTAIAVCMTVGGSVMIVFASLLRPFLKRD